MPPTAPDSSTSVTDPAAVRRRWWALITLCMGELMIVLDTSIANVALPSIQAELNFSASSLVWVVNAYMLTYGGFLLLGGRLGDLYGARRAFLWGLAVFALASAACGLAQTQAMLIVARAVQGLGGAVVSAVALALIVNTFPEGPQRARAMGVYGFICASGGSIGVLLGGVITSQFNWHWVFLVNLPLGVAVMLATRVTVDADAPPAIPPRLDIGGAVTVTGSLLCAVYAFVEAAQAGWASLQTLGLLAVAAVLFAVFLRIERRHPAPLMPLSLFAIGNFTASSIVGALWAAAMFAWFFVCALYLQHVLGQDALQVGLAFLPANLIMAAFSLGLSARMVERYGLRRPLALGVALAGIGLGLFVWAPVNGSVLWHVMPGMLLLGMGCGMAFNPIMLAAMNGIPEQDAGVASGVLNTAFMMGGAVGLAVLASLAATRTQGLLASGTGPTEALLGGYHLAFGLGAACALLAGAICLRWLRDARSPANTHLH